MKRLFEFLTSGCWHHWEDYKEVGVQDSDKIMVGYAVMCKCTKCGMHKRFNLY